MAEKSDVQTFPATGRQTGPRQHHVAVHQAAADAAAYDEIVVFGTEIEALRHIVGKAGWEYKPLANGQPFSEAGS